MQTRRAVRTLFLQALEELNRALQPHRAVIGERAAARAAWMAQRQ
jgi:hypothetical protein